MDLLRMLVQVALVAAMAAPTTSAQANPPDCQHRCGSINIPYPFGIGPNCSYDEAFLVTCEKAFIPPKPFLAKDRIEITKISPHGELGIFHSIARDCYDQSGQRTNLTIPSITFSKFKISSTKNKLTAIGCDTRASIIGEKDGKNYSSGCMTTCDSPNYVTNGFCSGIGCCQTYIPKGVVDNYTMELDSHLKHRDIVWNFSPCSYAFVVEDDKFNFSSTYLVDLEKLEIKLPVVLDWAIGDENCSVAIKSSGYACKDNSSCSQVDFGPGYRCYCSEGYHGNPYVANGCQDIDECEDPALNQCEKICENIPGSYKCSCPKGHHGDGRKDGKGCIVDQQQEIKTGVGIGMGILVLIVGCSSLYSVINARMVKQLKIFFFEQNGGLLLQELLQSTPNEKNDGSVEPNNERNDGSVEPTNEINDGSVDPNNERNDGSVQPNNERNDGSVEPTNETNDGSVQPNNERNDGSVEPTNEKNDGSVDPNNERNDGSVEPTNEKNASVEPTNEKNDGSLEPNNERNDGSVEEKIFTIEELVEATNNFDEQRIVGQGEFGVVYEEVGQGGFGIVYEGVMPEYNRVAIKKFLKVDPKVDPSQVHQFIRNVFELFGIDQLLGGCLEEKVLPEVDPSQEQFIRNVAKLFRIDHKNVVKLLGCCLEAEVPYLVYEFIPNGSLYRHLHTQEASIPGNTRLKIAKETSIPWKTRLKIAKETAEALSYLHSISILHRDVKSTNILLEDDFTAKVSDVGASRIGQLDKIQLPTIQGTLGYLDPEYFSANQLSDKSDVYSFGVVLVELLTGRMAFSDDGPEEDRLLSTYFIKSIKKNREFLDDRIKNEKGITQQVRKVANLAQCCLRLEGDKRPTMRELKIKLEQIMRGEKHLRTSLDEKSKKTDPPSGKSVDYGSTSTSITDFVAGDDMV